MCQRITKNRQSVSLSRFRTLGGNNFILHVTMGELREWSRWCKNDSKGV